MLKGVDVGGSFVKVLWEDGRKEKHDIREIKKDRERQKGISAKTQGDHRSGGSRRRRCSGGWVHIPRGYPFWTGSTSASC